MWAIGSVMVIYRASFYMPLFYVVSGYLLNKKRHYREFVFNLCKKLLVPYYFFGFIGILIYFTLQSPNKEMLINLLFFPNKDNMPIVGAIWFLMSMFISESIYYYFYIYCRKKLLVLVTLAFLTFTIIPNFYNLILPFTLNTVGISCLYLYLGGLIKQNIVNNPKQNILTINKPYWLLMILFHIIICFFNGKVNYRISLLGHSTLLYLVISMLAIIAYWNLFKNIKLSNFFTNYIAYIGQNSMIYLVTNQFVILFYSIIVEKLFTNLTDLNSSLTSVFEIIIIFLLSLLSMHVLTRVFKRDKLKKLVGY